MPTQQILLLNAPVYDIRFPWAKFQQPMLLLQLATLFRQEGKDVRLIDPLYFPQRTRLRRELVTRIAVDDMTINKWRFGSSRSSIAKQMKEFAASGWYPEEIYIECFTTFWWEGAAEIAQSARTCFPGAKIILVGVYATLAPDHAKEHIEVIDEVWSQSQRGLTNLPPDISLYPDVPWFVYLSLGTGQRSAQEIVKDLENLAVTHDVYHFAFVNDSPINLHPDLYTAVLETIIDRKLKIRLYALGSITPKAFTKYPELAGLMHRAGYRQIVFADDRHTGISPECGKFWVEAIRDAAQLCHQAGFRPRTEDLTASLSLGRLGEDRTTRAELATLVSHHMGSVIFWPYQPRPEECSGLPLEDQNGKLFPLRGRNGATYRQYLELLGLATVLNAKYRQKTFDFLGNGLVAKLFQDSVARQGWKPNPEVKGSLKLPLIERERND